MTSFKQAYDRAERLMETRYGLPVSVGDVVDPNTGDFDGMRIVVDHDQELDAALFVLLHLFGHTVQWNLSAEARAVGLDTSPGKGEAEIARMREYERVATRYGLQLLREAGVDDLDRWASDWWDADWRWLAHYYRTGERKNFRDLLRPGESELLGPLAIPPFTPQRWMSRWSF